MSYREGYTVCRVNTTAKPSCLQPTYNNCTADVAICPDKAFINTKEGLLLNSPGVAYELRNSSACLTEGKTQLLHWSQVKSVFISGEVVTSPDEVLNGTILEHVIQYDESMNYALQAPVEDAAVDRMLRVKLWKYKESIKKLENLTNKSVTMKEIWLMIGVGLILIFLSPIFSSWIQSSCGKICQSKKKAAKQIK